MQLQSSAQASLKKLYLDYPTLPFLPQKLQKRVFELHPLIRSYKQISQTDNPKRFLELALQRLNIELLQADSIAQKIPQQGPIVIVANHPFGMLDGMLLAHLALKVRSDVKILANEMLNSIHELRSLFLAVDIFQGSHGSKKNSSPLRQAIRHVKSGGLLIVFPAGQVSHWQHSRRQVLDSQWHDSVGRLIQLTGADVLPAYVHGQNSWLFQCMGWLHGSLRTVMLPGELWRKSGKRITIKIGQVLPAAECNKLDSAGLLSYLRLLVYSLAKQKNSPDESDRLPPTLTRPNKEQIKSDLANIESQKLLAANHFDVYIATAKQIPNILVEIGYQREQTFQAVGEGTGNTFDLDRYDQYYQHLFIWDRELGRLVGAYRIGKTDEILAKYGRSGLYTSSLYRYKAGFFPQLGPALELGRSFIVSHYQKNYLPLLLLWRGIGQFILENPSYRMLFGPVSISNSYSPQSRDLMTAYLNNHYLAQDLAKQVKGNYRPPKEPVSGTSPEIFKQVVQNIEGLSRLIYGIEAENKGIPILLQQYLKLNGQVLAYNVDKDFSNVLDALLMVDLSRAPAKVLGRYMGKEGCQHYLENHSESAA